MSATASVDSRSMEDKLSLWNLRAAPASRPVSDSHLADVVQASASYLPASYCHFCQNEADLAPSLCKRCDRIQLIRECAAEGVGMFLLMFVGTASTAQYFLSYGYQGNFLAQALTWGIATTFGIYVAQGISGGHLSPGITISLALFRGYPWRRVLPLVFSQLAATFFAALIIFVEFKDWIYYREALDWTQKITPTATAPSSDAPHQLTSVTASIFVVSPASFVSTAGMIFDQFIGAAIHALGFAAVLDWKNSSAHAPGNLLPLISGLWVFAIIASFSGLSFYPFNVARNLGMQFGAAAVGYPDVFYSREWTFVFFPIFGSITGVLVYDLLIRYHHKPQWPYLWSINYARRLQSLQSSLAAQPPIAIGDGHAEATLLSASSSRASAVAAASESSSVKYSILSINGDVASEHEPSEGIYRSRSHYRAQGSATERLLDREEGKSEDSSPIQAPLKAVTVQQPGELELGDLRAQKL